MIQDYGEKTSLVCNIQFTPMAIKWLCVPKIYWLEFLLLGISNSILVNSPQLLGYSDIPHIEILKYSVTKQTQEICIIKVSIIQHTCEILSTLVAR